MDILASTGKLDNGNAQGAAFLQTIFAPSDCALIRPTATYTDAGHKCSRVDFNGIRHQRLGYVNGAGWCHNPEHLQRVLGLVAKRAELLKTNVFFGVCPRFGPGGQFDQSWQIRTVRVLWADIDHTIVDEALERCRAAGLPRPSIVVNSGHGVHLYWLLTEAFLIDDSTNPPAVQTEWIDEGPEHRKKRRQYIEHDGERLYLDILANVPPLSPKALHVQDILGGIASKIGGDHTSDLARSLRIPGTLNRKEQRNGVEPVPCEMIECEPGRRYPISEFERFAAESPDRVRREQVAKVKLPTHRKLAAKNTDRFNNLVLACETAPNGKRSEADYALCCWSIEHGVRRDEAWNAVANVGKFAESGEAYFDRTWTKAESHTRQMIFEKAAGKVVDVQPRQPVDQRGRSRKPEIDAGSKDLPVVTQEAWDAVRQANTPPFLFRYAGGPVRVETGNDSEPVLRSLDQSRLRYHAARAADWYRETDSGRISAMPSRDVIQDMLATPVSEIPLPILDRIIESPVFARDGTLILSPGYNEAGQTYYSVSKPLDIPTVNPNPTLAEISQARELIAVDLLGDFPFVGPPETAHAVAFCVLPFARDLIDGPTPMHLFEKPSPGTGATLLADVLAFSAIGRPIPTMSEGRDEDEWRKRLTSKLREGAPFIFIDNLRRRLDSAALSSAITSPVWEDRILGVSEMVRIRVRCAWGASGNNPLVSSEMSRRIVRIRLDAKRDQPWLRDESSFRHPNLREWIKANRPKLIWAALTLVQAWLAAGRPAGSRTLGMFEGWAKTIGGILDVAGIPGLLDNLQDFYSQSDFEGTAWRGFLGEWLKTHGTTNTAVSELYPLATAEALQLGDGSERSQKTRLGKLLTDLRERVFSVNTDTDPVEVRVIRAGVKHNSNQWCLERGTWGRGGLDSTPSKLFLELPPEDTPEDTRVGDGREIVPHVPTSPLAGNRECDHDYHDSGPESDGKTRRYCRKCNHFAGFVQPDGSLIRP